MAAALLLATLLPTSMSFAQSTGTGPEVGDKIPDFELVDHTGASRTFSSLVGDQGLLLLFSRSVDW